MTMSHVYIIIFFALENLSNIRKLVFFKALYINILLTVGTFFSQANADTEAASLKVGECITIFHLEKKYNYIHMYRTSLFQVRRTTFVKEFAIHQ